MKVLIQLSLDHYESLLAHFTKGSPTFSLLASGVKVPCSRDDTRSKVVALLCDPEQAGILLKGAIDFCPDAVPAIENAITVARFAMSYPQISETGPQARSPAFG